MSRKRPSVPKVTLTRADRHDAVDELVKPIQPAPVAGQHYDAEETVIDVEVVEPQPLGWVPAPPDTDTPIFNQVNAGRRWERLLAASRADTAAIRTHYLVTMSGTR